MYDASDARMEQDHEELWKLVDAGALLCSVCDTDVATIVFYGRVMCSHCMWEEI
jgi:hypothetical protein